MRRMSRTWFLVLAACGASSTKPLPPPIPITDRQLAEELAVVLEKACPAAAPDDRSALSACAEALTAAPFLRERLAEPFRWGGQKSVERTALADNHLTQFAPRVWRRIYLPVFTFPGGHEVTTAGEDTLLHMNIGFRDSLAPGDYPYPFWHSQKKWRDYEISTRLVFVIRGGRVHGAMRSAVDDLSRRHVDRQWDQAWRWAEGREPHVALFSEMFSAKNPHVADLDRAYRDLEGELRAHQCGSCHDPGNAYEMNPLTILTYPNQALVARRTLREQLEQGKMPPEDTKHPAGIADLEQRARFVALAKEFERVADLAMGFEEERR
jgi:hypothetical protein